MNIFRWIRYILHYFRLPHYGSFAFFRVAFQSWSFIISCILFSSRELPMFSLFHFTTLIVSFIIRWQRILVIFRHAFITPDAAAFRCLFDYFAALSPDIRFLQLSPNIFFISSPLNIIFFDFFSFLPLFFFSFFSFSLPHFLFLRFILQNRAD